MVQDSKPSNQQDVREKSILSQMKNQTKLKQASSSRQRVSDLVPNQKFQRLELVVLRRYPRSLVNSDNFTGSLAAACG